MKHLLSICFQILLVAVACTTLWHFGTNLLFKVGAPVVRQYPPISTYDGKLIINANKCAHIKRAELNNITLVVHNWYWIIETINSSSCILGQYRLIQQQKNMLIFDAKKIKSQSHMEQFIKNHGGNICALVLEKLTKSGYGELQLCKDWLEI